MASSKMDVVDKHFEDNSNKSSSFNRKKRIRCINFSSQEKNILIHIIEKYQDTIECKKTDKVSVLQRDSVWEGVAQEFNDIFLNETVRTPKQLKMCYDNLKRRIRKEVGSVVTDTKPAKIDINYNGALQSQVIDPSDDSNSSARLNGTSSFQDSADRDTPAQFQSESYSIAVFENPDSEQINDEPQRKKASFAKLRRELLSKQIMSADLDIEMKAKKYEMEIKVQQAKLEYYRKKSNMLDVQNTKPNHRLIEVKGAGLLYDPTPP